MQKFLFCPEQLSDQHINLQPGGAFSMSANARRQLATSLHSRPPSASVQIWKKGVEDVDFASTWIPRLYSYTCQR